MATFEIEPYLTVEMNQKAANVLAVLANAEAGGPRVPLSWTEAMDVLTLTMATLIEGDPGFSNRGAMRKVTEEYGSKILSLADQFRQMTTKTGQSHLQRLSGGSAR